MKEDTHLERRDFAGAGKPLRDAILVCATWIDPAHGVDLT